VAITCRKLRSNNGLAEDVVLVFVALRLLLVRHALVDLLVPILLNLVLRRLGPVFDLRLHLGQCTWIAEIGSEAVGASIALETKFMAHVHSLQ
jgi:hypothetical protein